MSRTAKIGVEHGLRFIGKPYIWAGQGAMGLDCSGLVVEMLRVVGRIGRKQDFTAQQLYNQFRYHERGTAMYGDLVFFGTDTNHITHVGVCVDFLPNGDPIVLEAAGGRRGVDTPEEAQRNEAMVTLRPMRDDAVAYCNPWG